MVGTVVVVVGTVVVDATVVVVDGTVDAGGATGSAVVVGSGAAVGGAACRDDEESAVPELTRPAGVDPLVAGWVVAVVPPVPGAVARAAGPGVAAVVARSVVVDAPAGATVVVVTICAAVVSG